MHGPVQAPPPHRPPARGTVLTLRVVFVAATVLSLGFLAWAALLRAAIVQRGQQGWWVFGGGLALFLGSCVVITSYPATDWRTNAAVGGLLLQIAGAVAYYLVVDIRAARTSGYGAGARPTGYGTAAPAHPAMPPAAAPPPYGAPPAAAPADPYAVTATGLPPYAPPAAHPAPPPHAPYGTDRRPRPQRIDRVRAELDELSDYLRKEEGR
ncbi:hypothetical protein GCM10010211_72160 [Streptomyces albospinus]|uniref:Integral membrane protein n=1 Tax=Streptomyces albospinus TaxID=285515 RepID=A0ABQ2VKN9_9ACTN|nr:hypothetical protein [Streptomyces albospinus]GGU94623.1 hypothetical protein GCM10010211_72160 [Streptomyces albospinus]